MTLPFPCLALVTDDRLRGNQLEEAVDRAVTGGVDLVQLRAKDATASELLEMAARLQRVIRGRTRFVINDRLDVALAVGADGVHLPEAGLPVAVARRLAGPGFLIGKSVHSVEAAVEASSADYLQVGTIFQTGSKPGATPAGPGLISAIAARVDVPILAIGGITAENVGEVISAGAAGLAVISAILDAPDPVTAAAGLRDAAAAAARAAEAVR